MQAPTKTIIPNSFQSTSRWAAPLLRRVLSKLNHGHLRIIDGEHISEFGNKDTSLHAEIVVHHKDFYRSCLMQGTVGRRNHTSTANGTLLTSPASYN